MSTDPTYKEWKRRNLPFNICIRVSTDPTYKEWKRHNTTLSLCMGSCTDPTYKEWKRLNVEDISQRVISHGSYLQGMETGALDCHMGS